VAIADLISRLLRRNQNLDELQSNDRQDFLREAADMGEQRLHMYQLAQDYYDGEHRTRLLDRAKIYLEASGLRYCENFCETIVDVMAQRMKITAFQVDENETLSDWLSKKVWAANDMPETQGVVHTQTTIKGDGFLIVTYDQDTGLPKFTWNRPEIIKPVYDDDGEMLYASKIWTTCEESPTNEAGAGITRMNLFFPDRVEKWFTVGEPNGKATWFPHLDEEDMVEGTGVWPTPWTMPDGEPIGIPVIHFRNKPKGRPFGVTELRGPIPQQDALAKQLMDLFYVMDSQGWKQRWATGVGDGESITVAIGEFLKSTNENAKFGEFDAEDPGPMGEAIEGTLRRMAARSQTPLHLLMTGGTLPSGETLKTAESGLVHKVEDRQTTHGSSWRRANMLGVRLVEAFGMMPAQLDEDAQIQVIWDGVESRNEQAETNTLGVQVEVLGLSKTTALRKLGFDPEEEAELREKEQAEVPVDPLVPGPPDAPVVVEPEIPKPSPEPKE
jgi:Phage portal protein, SPP1 Gp6-like